ncbi:aminodeoxychorismate synthase component I [Cupriavidus basilensis]|uniref:aminodeoxychorismate synthase component I n=1 Tax=Cupriavidus basilensis TaxID=68895 RepID=UPI0028528B71|nr:aminodeoxychorismate synthase component I [Cupriavidus basilensis]
MSDQCYALLDDANATPGRPTSRLYTGLLREIRCTDPAGLGQAWQQADAAMRGGAHAVLLGDYEWGMALQGLGHLAAAQPREPALRILLFRELARLSREQVDAWLARMDGATPSPAGAGAFRPSVDRPTFHAAIARILEALRAGETYQVNYTYRIDFEASGSPLGLYRRLRARQPVPYGALIALPHDAQQPFILSCSPELFLRHEDGKLTARPMKGTAPRGANPVEDRAIARALAADDKNRAENLMIVDLLRNDLGRVAQIGSVKVPALFSIEPYASVFQMTSTVEATLPEAVSMPALLRALFPCGSITGAPRHHTMELIATLEASPRGLYTGAIGWIDAPAPGSARACGSFCLSVAIRTLALGPALGGVRAGRMGVGAGIVLDSEAASEFQECALKAAFLTGLVPDPGPTPYHVRDLSIPNLVVTRAAHATRTV